jgi:DNA-binding transcriptional ArsR family regulator
MASNQGEPEFNRARAELFEALGHPTRIRILQTLEHKSTGFAELKKAVGIESSGHLTFHLGKLEGLLKVGDDRAYSLTDEGREALRVIAATRDEGNGGIRVNPPRNKWKNVAIVALLVGILVVSSVAILQQQQIGALNRSISSQQVGTVVVNGTRYSYLDIPLQSLGFPTTIYFDGVRFNLTAPPSWNSSIVAVRVSAQQGIGQPLLNSSFVVTVSAQQGNESAGSGIPFTVILTPLGVNVHVGFADGQSEDWPATSSPPANSTTTSTGIVYFTFPPPTANPWFTHHTNPRAGVYFNPTTDSLRLMVSIGT